MIYVYSEGKALRSFERVYFEEQYVIKSIKRSIVRIYHSFNSRFELKSFLMSFNFSSG